MHPRRCTQEHPRTHESPSPRIGRTLGRSRPGGQGRRGLARGSVAAFDTRSSAAARVVAGAAALVAGTSLTAAPPTPHCPGALVLGHESFLGAEALDLAFPFAAADLDGDGRAELYFRRFGDSDLYMTRAGGGRLAPPKALGLEIDGGDQFVFEDLDGDGDDDLLVWGFNAGVTAAFNDGTGRLSPTWSIPGGGQQIDVRVGLGGQRSLVMHDLDRRTLDITLDDDGMPGEIEVVEDAELTHAVAIDVDGDGIEDLISGAINVEGSWTFRLGAPDGSLGGATPLALGPITNQPLTVADATGDGIEDLIVPRFFVPGEDDVLVLPRAADGGFEPGQFLRLQEGRGAIWVTVGDVDGDPHPDLLVFSSWPENQFRQMLDLFRGDGTGGHAFAIGYPDIQGGGVLADFDGDGLDDVSRATRFPIEGQVTISFGRAGRAPGSSASGVGGGTEDALNPSDVSAVDLAVEADLPGLLVASEDRLRLDGWNDETQQVEVISELVLDGPIRSLARGGDLGVPAPFAVIVVGDGDRRDVAFVSVERGRLVVETALSADDVGFAAAGDFDGDGDDDLVWATFADATTASQEDGGFGAPVAVDGVSGEQALAVGDFDGDGFDDAVFLHGFDDVIRIRFGSPKGLAGSDAATISLQSPFTFARFTTVDWDGDGRVEVLVTDDTISDIDGLMVLSVDRERRATLATVDATVGGGVEPPLFNRPQAAVGPLGPDGVPGIVASTASAWVVGVRSGEAAAPSYEASVSSRRLTAESPDPVIADFDGDGINDVAVVSVALTTEFLFGEPCRPVCLGDLDGDAHVDFEDLLTFIALIDPSILTPNAVWDLDGDGEPRTMSDLIELLASWGPCGG